jgi:hypothetical protein
LLSVSLMNFAPTSFGLCREWRIQITCCITSIGVFYDEKFVRLDHVYKFKHEKKEDYYKLSSIQYYFCAFSRLIWIIRAL